MKTLHSKGRIGVITACVIAMAVPAPGLAQTASAPSAASSNAAEVRIRKLEAEVAALQRQVFPGGDGKFFAPAVQPARPIGATGTPATTPVSDLLTRMEALESQIARLTAQNEEQGNKLAQLEARVAALSGASIAATPAAVQPAATSAAATPVPQPSPSVAAPPATNPPASASAVRVAAVKAIEKPQTADAGDDEYSYGYRLWDAKFYPEAQQQLKLYLQKYPKHSRVSYARNLLGRAYLDGGNPREAASWFLQNYQASKTGERAPDSLLFLAEAMRQMKDTSRSCVALSQFSDDYPAEAAGRLKAAYDALKAQVKCK